MTTAGHGIFRQLLECAGEMETTPRPMSLRDWLKFVLWAILIVPVALLFLYRDIRSIDPPWSVSELNGVIISWGAGRDPSAQISYYKMRLSVKVDDGRLVEVFSERRSSPALGERITVQERSGLFGTHKFIELVRN
jgi:hypothetical protein